jgi:hypothetical protein
MVSTVTETLPYGGANDTPVADDLDFARVLQIFLRTWPFIKPLTRPRPILGAGNPFVVVCCTLGGALPY